MLFPGIRPFLRRLACTGALAVVPWLPGLAAIPISANAGRPSTAAAPAARSAPAAPPQEAGGEAALPARVPPDSAPEPVFVPAGPPQPDEVWIEVDLAQQRVRVRKEAEVIREMVASTGTPDKPTPQGSFRLENRGEWFFSEKYKQGGFYWVSFLNRGEYLFHSVPTDRHRRIIPEEAARLGQPASHGCVRLSLEDARWIYENLPAGTRVEIHT